MTCSVSFRMVIGSYIYISTVEGTCYKCVKRKKNVDVWECINVFNRPLKCSVGGRNKSISECGFFPPSKYSVWCSSIGQLCVCLTVNTGIDV